MIYDRELLGRLDELHADRWQGEVFRHMFGDYPPDRENQRGARWNPAETPAIYTSLTRELALAEADFQMSLQPVRPTATRTIYRIGVVLSSVMIEPVWSHSDSRRKVWLLSTMAPASAWVAPSRGSATMVSWFRLRGQTASTW